MLSIIGVILGIALFVYAAYKRVNIILASLVASIIMVAFSQMPIYESLTGPYMSGLSQFLNKYFLMVLLSAVLGRLMSDGGGARKIAIVFGRLMRGGSDTGKKFLSVLFVAALYFLFSYVGISGYVLVFTIMPIAKHLFEATDTPWQLYCFGGPQIASSAMLAGSLNQGNIFAADVCGTSTSVGGMLSVIAMVVWWATTLMLIKWFLKTAEKRHETFLTDGSAIKAAGDISEGLADNELPSLASAIIPLALLVVCTTALQLDIVMALCIGCATAVVLLFKNLKKDLVGSLSKGISDSYGSAFTVAALYGFGTVVKTLPAFASFSEALSTLPGFWEGSVLGLVSAFIIAGSPIPIFGHQMLDGYLSAGLSPALAHRMMTIAGWSSIAPHSAGLTNSSSVTKIDYGRCLKVYMTAAYIPGIIVILVCSLLLETGLLR